MKKLFISIIILLFTFNVFGHSKTEAAMINASPYKANLVISVSWGNVRTGPSTSYNVVATLKNGSGLQSFEKATTNGVAWYHVKINGTNTVGWVSSTIVSPQVSAPAASSSVVLNAPLIAQKPQLANGCEVTSLTMMLQYAGIPADKMTLASQIKKVPPGQNPNDGFVGDMYRYGHGGLGVYHGPVAALARQYLGNRVVDLTGSSFDSVIGQLNKNKPVWVINNVTFNTLPQSAFQTWYTTSGPVRVTTKMHAVLVTGYDSQYVYFNDPLAVIKNRKVAKTSFINGWEQMGRQAISYN